MGDNKNIFFQNIFIFHKMNYLDAERTRYQNQDRYATRIKKLELF